MKRPPQTTPAPAKTAAATASPPARWRGRLREWGLVLGLFAAAMGAFWPAINNGFVWDDSVNFVQNFQYRGLTRAHLHWMFTTFWPGHYQPLTWLTHGLDYWLGGMNPRGYHLASLLWHSLNVVCFYFLIKALLRRLPDLSGQSGTAVFSFCCVAGALFFGLHPLRVESVAWITERRDVLCGFFYLLTLLAWLRWLENPARRRWYVFALLFYLGSLLSKAMGMTLPAVLLVLDVYPLRRLEWAAWRTSVKRLLVEKIPWFLLALIFAGVALAASQKHGVAPAGHDVFRRLVQAVYGLGFYPGKTVLPLDLSPLYILPPHFDPSAPRFLLAVTVVPLTAAALFLGRRRWPWAVAAAFAYAIIISPVLGLAQVGDQLVADRYSYLSCLPFAVLVAAALARLWLEWQAGTWTRVAWLAAAIGVTVWVGDLARQTYQQCGVWHDSFSLWDHAIRCDPANAVAFYNRGTMWQAQGDFDRAVADYETTLRLDPAYAKAYTNRGTIRQIRKNWTGARADYDMAIRVNAREARAYYNRGLLRKRQRDFEGTLADFDAAIRFKPNFFEAFTNRSVVRLNRGDVAGALADGDMAIRVSPRDPESYAHRAGLRLKQKDAAGAAADYAKALAVAPLNWPRRAAVEQQLQILRAPLPVHTPQPSR